MLYDVVQVPSSLRPSGFYQLSREFLLPELSPHQRSILHFDAITYYGRVSVNGAELGTMGPYVPYEFDCTRQSRSGNNTVQVAIADLTPDPSGAAKDELALGVNPGWEAYGGIIRDVYVEVRPAAFIDNVGFGYTLNADYTEAACRARVMISSVNEASANIELVLLRAGTEVARVQKNASFGSGSSEVEVEFRVNSPVLWSSEAPNLYELRARLRSDHSEDEWRCRTGFRELVTRGPDFLLNGKRLVLNGVCRHDMWKGQGFTLTRQQMEQDMRMIKALGANFVRLVHYPHHQHIVELADELGLLVTEEPGYWGMDFRTMPRTMIELGYHIMERTIRRDWNSPSVFAWLLGNECTLTVEYLKEGKERCRKLDPLARPVSFANSMGVEKAKPIFEQAGMDFFDAHAYPSDPQEYARTAERYGDSRPLTFTEWGWEQIGDKDIFPESDSELILDLVKAGKLAGHSFWSWQDMRQYSRIDWPTADSILMSGVVNEAREVRVDWFMEL
ncbi:MAG: glycoside hydrolase family 2 TIM barrel-domain containing protein [Terriglobia bacterium]